MYQQPEHQLQHEQHHHPPHQLWELVQPFPGCEYGHHDKETFRLALLDSIRAHPHRTHFIIPSALPASGKTALSNELIHNLIYGPEGARGPESLADFADQTGYRIKASTHDWGAAFLQIPPHLRVDSVDYHDDPELLERKRIEIELASRIYALGFQLSAERYYVHPYETFGIDHPNFPVEPDDRVIHIVVGDHPGPTGEGNVGIDRATRELHDLANHTGSFAGLEYEAFFLGMIAQPDVRAHAMQNRALLDETGSAAKRKQAMRDRGMKFQSGSAADVQRYVEEAAPPKEIMLVETDLDAFLRARWESGQTLQGYEYAGGPADLSPQARAEYLGREIMPDFYSRMLAVPDPERVIVLSNYEVLQTVEVPMIAGHRPLDDIAQHYDFAARLGF